MACTGKENKMSVYKALAIAFAITLGFGVLGIVLNLLSIYYPAGFYILLAILITGALTPIVHQLNN